MDQAQLDAFLKTLENFTDKLGTISENLGKRATEASDRMQEGSRRTLSDFRALGSETEKLSNRIKQNNDRQAIYGDSVKQNEETIKRFSKTIRDSSSSFARQLASGTMSMNEWRDSILSAQAEIARDTNISSAKRQQLIDELTLLERRSASEAKLIESTDKYNKVLGDISKVWTPVGALVGGLARAYQSGASNIQNAAQVLTAETQFVASNMQAAGQGLTQLGTMGMTSQRASMRRVGALAVGAGMGLEFLGKAASKSTEIINFMATEGQQFVDSYAKVSASGASFTEGMVGLRDAAHSAGMLTQDFADVVSRNSQNFADAGMSMDTGVRLLGNASKQLRDPDRGLGLQLFRLGITDIKEQTDLAAKSMSMLKTAGYSNAEINNKLAETTVQYTKDLRVLQSITGEDAAKKQKEAEQTARLGEVLATFTDPKQAENFQKVFATLPDKLKPGFLDLVSSGGKMIADSDAQLAMSRNATIEPYLRNLYDAVYNTSMSSTQALDYALQQRAETSKASIANVKSVQDFLAGTRLGRISENQGAAAILNDFLRPFSDPEQIQKVRDSIEKQSTTANTMTDNMGGTIEEFNKLRVQIQGLTQSDTGMGKFFEIMKGGMTTMNDFFRKIENFVKTGKLTDVDKNGKPELSTGLPKIADLFQNMLMGAQAGALAAAPVSAGLVATGVAAPGAIVTETTGIVAGALSGAVMSVDWGQLGSYIKNKIWSDAPQQAAGGFVSGSSSGYPVVMHGAEAVLPLDNATTMNRLREGLMLDQDNGMQGNTANMRELFTSVTNSMDATGTLVKSVLQNNSTQDQDQTTGAITDRLAALQASIPDSLQRGFTDIITKMTPVTDMTPVQQPGSDNDMVKSTISRLTDMGMLLSESSQIAAGTNIRLDNLLSLTSDQNKSLEMIARDRQLDQAMARLTTMGAAMSVQPDDKPDMLTQIGNAISKALAFVTDVRTGFNTDKPDTETVKASAQMEKMIGDMVSRLDPTVVTQNLNNAMSDVQSINFASNQSLTELSQMLTATRLGMENLVKPATNTETDQFESAANKQQMTDVNRTLQEHTEFLSKISVSMVEMVEHSRATNYNTEQMKYSIQ